MTKQFVAFLLLAGCAPRLNQKQIDLFASVGPKGQSIPCDSVSCADLWSKAQVWLAKHSNYKIQTITDSIIETYGPTYDLDPMSCGFTILKEPVGQGRFMISVNPKCFDKMISSRIPEPGDISNAFIIYLESGRDILEEAGPPLTAVNP